MNFGKYKNGIWILFTGVLMSVIGNEFWGSVYSPAKARLFNLLLGIATSVSRSYENPSHECLNRIRMQARWTKPRKFSGWYS